MEVASSLRKAVSLNRSGVELLKKRFSDLGGDCKARMTATEDKCETMPTAPYLLS